jgi:glycosyltransferase involved in cell wall biosynthesis
MKPSGILHVIASMDPEKGGVSKAVRLIITGLEKHGIHSEVVTLDPPDNDFCSDDSFTVFTLGPQKTSWQYSKKLIPWLVDNFQNYDAVILHGLWLYNSYALGKVFSAAKKNPQSYGKGENKFPKFFVMPHGMLDPYFQKAARRKFKAIRNLAYWKLIERKTVNISDGLLFTCEQEKLLARHSFHPYSPKLEIIVGLGVEEPPPYTSAMQQAFSEKFDLPLNTPYLLFLGRVNEKKGVDILIDAYTKICNDISPDLISKERNIADTVNIPALIIAGPELESPFGRKIKKIVWENNILKNKVFLLGMLSGDAKWGAFYGSDAFILPSHQENFGIAVVEAMACSKPVLISNQVNIWREIKESGGGLIENDTQHGIIKILQNWYASTDIEKKTMNLNARKCFENHFSGGFFAEKIIHAVYQNSHQHILFSLK